MHEYRTAPYQPPVHLAPPPSPPRRRSWWATVEPVYRTLAAGACGLLAAAVLLRVYGVTAWVPALAAAFAAPAAGWVTSERGGNRRDQAETAVVVAVAGGWLVFVAAAGWDPHHPGVPFAPLVPAGGFALGVAGLMCLIEHRAKVRDRAVKAARAAGMPAPAPQPAAGPAPAEPKEPVASPRPARPGPDEGPETEMAAVAGVQLEEVRRIWADVTGRGATTSGDVSVLLGCSRATAHRRLKALADAGYLRVKGRPGEQRFVPVRGGLLHRVR